MDVATRTNETENEHYQNVSFNFLMITFER